MVGVSNTTERFMVMLLRPDYSKWFAHVPLSQYKREPDTQLAAGGVSTHPK